MPQFCINGRFLRQETTGVQRYARGIIDHLRPANDDILKCPADGRLPAMLWEQYELPRMLRRKGRPLLLNFCNTAPVVYDNQVVTIHDMAVFRNPQWFHRAFVYYYRWLLPRIAQRSKHVVTVSEFSKSKIVHFLDIPAEKISVIPGAAHPSLLHAEPVKPNQIGSKPFVLIVGSRDPRKNIDMVTRAAGPVLAGSGHALVIAGNRMGPFPPAARHVSAEILWLDAVTDPQLKWLYGNARLTIQSSFYEGFSLVPVESLAFGTPVLVSDIPVHREILGNKASYFDPRDPLDLERKLDATLNSTAQPEAVATAFDFKESARLWHLLIDRLSG